MKRTSDENTNNPKKQKLIVNDAKKSPDKKTGSNGLIIYKIILYSLRS